MTKDYIEREAALQAKPEFWNDLHGNPAYAVKAKVHNDAVIDYLREIESIPAADVRPVVLCKDCKYYPTGTDNGKDQGFGLEWPEKELHKCPFMCYDGWYSRKPRPDFFCANGERPDIAPASE